MLDNLLSKTQIKSVIGGDLIASLSMGLYNNPLEIYRELVQNATDAYQINKMPPRKRRIEVEIDRMQRTVIVRDYATGLAATEITRNLFSIGNSKKRGKQLRGFRGLGRLAALGYCRELLFRSRKSPKDPVWELSWDGLSLHQHLSKPNGFDIGGLFKSISTLSQLETREWPDCFFECELRGVRASKNDIILNPDAVSAYLSEIAPVGFHPDFSFARKIYNILGKQATFEVKIFVNGSDEPLTRPHTNKLVSSFDPKTVITTINEVVPISKLDDGFENIAKGWILHHDYPGALPQVFGIRGLRIRIGNMQIGDERILESMFKEIRFNSWCIGEIHIITPNIRPNTRRDNLELSPTLDNLENSLHILARKLTQTCREKSSARTRRVKIDHRTLNISKRKYREIVNILKLKEPIPDKLTLFPKNKTGD